jgi:hypothetical protein
VLERGCKIECHREFDIVDDDVLRDVRIAPYVRESGEGQLVLQARVDEAVRIYPAIAAFAMTKLDETYLLFRHIKRAIYR